MKAILTYHSLDTSGSVVSVHPDRFREHLDLLGRGDVPVLPLARLLDPDCDRGVALTFDDGFENFATVAWPLLRERGWPATLYVATEWVGKQNAWDPTDDRIPRLPLLGWPALRVLADEGLEIGSHSLTHPRLTALADGALAEEVGRAREVITGEIGRVPESFAYPYGDYNARVAEAAERTGYGSAVTTELRPLTGRERSRFALPRLDAYYLAKPGVMERWGTPAFGRYVLFRSAARSMRRFLSRTTTPRGA
ncbi:MAG: polysaccharide deacetylase family protein [Longimicrobiales bacterium]